MDDGLGQSKRVGAARVTISSGVLAGGTWRPWRSIPNVSSSTELRTESGLIEYRKLAQTERHCGLAPRTDGDRFGGRSEDRDLEA